MKIDLKDGRKPEGWTRNEHKEIEKFNDLTVDSFEVEVEFEECQVTVTNWKMRCKDCVRNLM